MKRKQQKKLWNLVDQMALPPPEPTPGPRKPTSQQGKTTSCGKHGFTSEKQAKKAMRHRLTKGANVSRLRVYKCQDCHHFHFTSQFR